MEKKLISIVSPTFNEEANIYELYTRIISAIEPLERVYNFEIIIIDNCSTDSTVKILESIALNDRRVKIIVNVRNFGHIRSPYYGLLQSFGNATIYLASDLQDPPELIPEFIEAWEKGYKLVMAVKPTSEASALLHNLRRFYYKLLNLITDIKIIKDCTGFGLYDLVVLDHLRIINDPYPFLRGLISELGYPVKEIVFKQPRRSRGISKNNIYTLLDIAILGIVTHSKFPIRLASLIGFLIGSISVLIAVIYLLFKLIYWDSLPIGVAPLIIGFFLLQGLQFIFTGLVGEYLGIILAHVQRRPIVVEDRRINFDDQAKFK